MMMVVIIIIMNFEVDSDVDETNAPDHAQGDNEHSTL